ncbi:MAG: 4Fe-4S dicluster domain-containing protein, partial [Chlorobi bacterium]|nr:4Fe-4S dicluster domain-containing protein [Chlorobiota bacterium]
MMVFDHTEPVYWDKEDLKKEMFRVFDICNGCRLCDNLCPSFNKLFRRIEEEDDRLTAVKSLDNPVAFLTDRDYEEVTDLCYQCKLCYPKCPYTPPHDYLLDFPRLLTRAQAIRVREKGISFRDKLLSDPDRAGSIGSKFPRLMNWLNSNALSRAIM